MICSNFYQVPLQCHDAHLPPLVRWNEMEVLLGHGQREHHGEQRRW